MIHKPKGLRSALRTGASAVEFAVVASVTLLLIFFLTVGGMGVFRYQEVAHLAREGSRYASTHGGQYQLEGMPAQTGVAAVSSSADVQAYLLPKAIALDTTKLTITASWSPPAGMTPINMPTYVNTDPTLVPPAQTVTRNYVTVTVSYQWMPEFYLVGPITLSSTSTIAMSY